MSNIMQVRCINCKKEQYAMAVFPISQGKAGCSWCGYVPKPFTSEKAFWKEYDSTAPYSLHKPHEKDEK